MSWSTPRSASIFRGGFHFVRAAGGVPVGAGDDSLDAVRAAGGEFLGDDVGQPVVQIPAPGPQRGPRRSRRTCPL